MLSHEQGTVPARMLRIAAAFALAALTGGCFQPVYGTATTTISGEPGIRTALAGVAVEQISAPRGGDESRLAVEVRNAILFDLTGDGGNGPALPSHRLKVTIASTRSSVIIDITSQRPNIENYGINTSYSLTEVATGKVVVTGSTFSRVTYDIPAQEQRFARLRGLRDAEDRAAKVIAENIRSRLASYFIAGT